MQRGHGTRWFYWPLFGWSIGLAVHGLEVFGFLGLSGREWEEREIQKQVEKERERQAKG